MLHDLMHTRGLPHSNDPMDIIAGDGFIHINRHYMFVAPPCENNPRCFEPTEGQATYIAPLSGACLKTSRWFALDDKPWKDGGKPRISAVGKEGDILIEAEHGLGYPGFDVKGDVVAFKTRGPPDRDPPTSHRLTAAEVQEMAGTTDIRIRAFDLQGQYSEADIKDLKR